MLKEHLLPKAEDLESIARKSGLIQRASHKFSASGFLLALVQSITKGDTSLNHIVMHLAPFVRETMTRQAIHQRFGPASSAFLLGVIREVLSKRFPKAVDALRNGSFSRVIIEDSTVVSMAKSNAGEFPNNGNGRYETAGCKCLLIADLLNGEPLDLQLHAAREADQSLAFETVDLCRQGDLVVRDMGFFQVDALREIGERKAFWISRLPASVTLTTSDGAELAKLLRKTKGRFIDQAVSISRKNLACRLIAIRLDPVRASANRRHLRSEAKRRRVTPNKESILRAGWRILITNIESSSMDSRSISDIYALRWSIEIKFRAFKQSCQIGRSLKHKSGFHHIEAMVLASMLYQLLTLRLHAELASKPEYQGWLSIEKLSDAFSIYLMRLTSDSQSWQFNPDPRHLRYEHRKRTNHWQAITHSLA